MRFTEVLSKTALEQAELIKSKQISSEELVKATLERLDALNPKFNAFVTLFHRRALRDAKAKDAAVRRGEKLPAFHGVPIGVKDLNFVRFSRTRMGSAGSLPFLSPMDDRSAASVRRGGFVILGKTATSEVGALPVTEPDIHPPTKNPWNLGHTSGGSSGGAAAAVAAHLLPIAHGSDGGGSVRLPSAFCHLFGHKASRGRIPNAFGRPDQEIIYTCGPLAHSVEDAATLLDILARLDIGKPHWAPAPSEPYRAAITRAPGKLRVRFTTFTPLTATDPEIAEGVVVRVAKLLAAEGHEVEEMALPTATLEEFLPVWQHLIATIPLIRWSKTQPVTKWLHDEGIKLDPEQVATRRRELERRFVAAFENVDVWLTPTSPVVAPALGRYGGLPPAQAFHEVAPVGAFTAIFNATGQPAASVPMGLTRAGMPMGVQLAGRPLGDEVVLRLARQLEQLMPWRGRVAPESA